MAAMTSLVSRSEGHAAIMNFQQWLQQGETIYQTALKEFHSLEAQIEELEARLAAKLTEVNQIAAVLGKSAIESSRHSNGHAVATQVINGQPVEETDRVPSTPSSANNIARALTGKFGR